MGQVQLWVDNEDSAGNWDTTGSPPYLSSQNQPTDYISDTGRNDVSGTYSFQGSARIVTRVRLNAATSTATAQDIEWVGRAYHARLAISEQAFYLVTLADCSV